jgi:hypothetical protein
MRLRKDGTIIHPWHTRFSTKDSRDFLVEGSIFITRVLQESGFGPCKKLWMRGNRARLVAMLVSHVGKRQRYEDCAVKVQMREKYLFFDLGMQ